MGETGASGREGGANELFVVPRDLENAKELLGAAGRMDLLDSTTSQKKVMADDLAHAEQRLTNLRSGAGPEQVVEIDRLVAAIREAGDRVLSSIPPR